MKTLLDEFACVAMQVAFSFKLEDRHSVQSYEAANEEIAEWAYDIAEAMLKEKQRRESDAKQ
jgi:hypothetical protein